MIIKILPLGDSFTGGGGNAGNGLPPPGSYRAPLYEKLTADGYNVQYVGNQTYDSGGGLPANEVNHEGLGGYGVVNVAGDPQNPGILEYLQSNNILQTYTPDVILLMAGYNNIYSSGGAGTDLSPNATYAAMEKLVTYIEQTLPNVKIIVATHPGDPTDPGNDPSNALGQLNALLPGLTAISPNISIFDGTAGFKYDGSDTGLDGLHPNVAGSAAIASMYENAVKAVIPLGAQPDTLTLKVSEDAWQGDAYYTVSVDGKQAGGILTATASHVAGQSQTVTLNGNWGTGSHQVSIDFLNDVWGGTIYTDRNLYVAGASYDNTVASNANLNLYTSGAMTFMTTPAPTATAQLDTLTLNISEDAWKGDAQYTVSVDGNQIGGILTATASHATSQFQTVTFSGFWGASPHQISVDFLNDAWGGTITTDRNLYVSGASHDGVAAPNANLNLYVGGSQSFTVK